MDPDLDEDTGTRESRRADDLVHTAEQDVVRSDNVLNAFQRAMMTASTLYQRNHFAENALLIMRSPARKAS